MRGLAWKRPGASWQCSISTGAVPNPPLCVVRARCGGGAGLAGAFDRGAVRVRVGALLAARLCAVALPDAPRGGSGVDRARLQPRRRAPRASHCARCTRARGAVGLGACRAALDLQTRHGPSSLPALHRRHGGGGADQRGRRALPCARPGSCAPARRGRRRAPLRRGVVGAGDAARHGEALNRLRPGRRRLGVPRPHTAGHVHAPRRITPLQTLPCRRPARSPLRRPAIARCVGPADDRWLNSAKIATHGTRRDISARALMGRASVTTEETALKRDYSAGHSTPSARPGRRGGMARRVLQAELAVFFAVGCSVSRSSSLLTGLISLRLVVQLA